MIANYVLAGALILFPVFSYLLIRQMVKMGGRKTQKTEFEQFLLPTPEGARIDVAEPHAAVPNLRDLGGYRTADGAVVRTGAVYRSGSLEELSDEDAKTLWDELAVQTVCDLRSKREKKAKPDRLPAGVTGVGLEVEGSIRDVDLSSTLLFERDKLGEDMKELYLKSLEHGGKGYGELIRRCGQEEQLPLLFHCTHGKDRSGIAAALLLMLLNVPREAILADYSQSNRYAPLFWEQQKQRDTAAKRWGIPDEEHKIVMAADPAWMRAVMEAVDSRYGGIEAYLTSAGGLTKAELEQVRTTLLLEE